MGWEGGRGGMRWGKYLDCVYAKGKMRGAGGIGEYIQGRNPLPKPEPRAWVGWVEGGHRPHGLPY